MLEIDLRQLHLIKKALAIAVVAIEEKPGPFQSGNDMLEMKGMLDELMSNDGELAHYMRSARIVYFGSPDI